MSREVAGSLPTIAGVLASAVRQRPGSPAVLARSGTLTYAQLDAAASASAGALWELGVRPGDRVAACLPNDLDVVVAFHGTQRIGAIWAGIGEALTAAEQQSLADAVSPAVILAGPKCALDGPAVTGTRRWAELMAAGHHGAARAGRSAGAGRHRVLQWHHRRPEGGRAQPAQPAAARRSAGRDPRLGRGPAQGRQPAVHDPEHARAVHAADRAGWRLLGRHGPARPGRGRGMDRPHRRDSVERRPGPAVRPGQADRPGPAAADRGLDRRRHLSRACARGVPARHGIPVTCTYGLSEAPTVVAIDPAGGGGHREGASGQVLPHLHVAAYDDDGRPARCRGDR